MNKNASELGKLSVKKRFKGLTKEEISKVMSNVRKMAHLAEKKFKN